MSMIAVKNLTFAYDGNAVPVFEGLNLQVDTAWKLGLVGRNGRGKTTLLRLLMGQYACRGSITASVPFAYFPYEVPAPEQSVLEVLRNIAQDAETWQIERELSLLELHPACLEQAFATLSQGEQTKALLAALFLKEDAFLLIDEPTNHLDAEGRRKLADYLRRKRGFLLVSHDRAFLDGCVDHILALNKSGVELQRGNFSAWWETKRQRDERELAENEKLKREIDRLDLAQKRTAAWSDRTERGKYGGENSGLKVDRGYVGHRSAKMMKRAKSIAQRRESAAEEKRGLLKDLERSDALSLTPLAWHAKRLAELQEVTVCYDGRQICAPVSFAVERGDRVLLRGKNGCGKSSLLKRIAGQDIPGEGRVTLGAGLQLSCVPQDTAAVRGGLRTYIQRYDLEEHRMKAILRKLGFAREQFDLDLSALSAGQKKKILLAKSLCQSAHLYLWDEPLNYIDIFSRMQLEELLLEYQPALVFVEHDAAFAERIATKIIEL